MAAIVTALRDAASTDGRPKAIVLRTLPGKGVPTLERREKAHFVRVDPGEWDALIAEFERTRRRPMSDGLERRRRTLAMGQDEATGGPTRRRGARSASELGGARPRCDRRSSG